MYILNPDKIKEEKIFWCNGLVAEWLIEKKGFDIFCQKDRRYGFSKTKSLLDALKDIPFYLKVASFF